MARRVDCAACEPTVAAVLWARHASGFTRVFEDLVVHDAIVGNKNAAAKRYGVSWHAVNNMCIRLADEALGRVDLLAGLTAIVIDAVKYKKGHNYFTVACDWASPRHRPDRLGLRRPVKGDRRVVLRRARRPGRPPRVRDRRWRSVDPCRRRQRAPDAILCLDTFHIVSWAIDALDEVRHEEWNQFRAAGAADAAKEF